MTKSSPNKTILERYTSFILKNKGFVIALSLFVTIAFAYQAKNLRFDNNYEAFFGDDNPQLLAYQDLYKIYNKSDSILFLFTPTRKDGQVFDTDVLSAIEDFTERAWRELPHSRRVDSITNFQHTSVEDDDLTVKSIIEDVKSMSKEDINKAKDILYNEPEIKNNILSLTHEATAVSVMFNLDSDDLQQSVSVAKAAHKLAKSIESSYPVKVQLTGVLMINNEFLNAAIKDVTTLYPLMYLLIIGLIFMLTGSFFSALSVLLIISCSIIIALGSASLLGIDLTTPSATSTSIITTLSVAGCIHYLTTTLGFLNKGLSKHEALIEAMKSDFKPLFLTSITTAIGFFSLNTSDSPPFSELGNITAIGILMAFFFSVSLLPCLLSYISLPKKKELKLNLFMVKVAKFTIAHRTIIFLSVCVISVFLISMIPKNNLRDDFMKYFHAESEVRMAVEDANTYLNGVIPIEFAFDSEISNGINNPEYLEKLDQLYNWLIEQPEVATVKIVSNTYKRLNKTLHNDEQDYYSIPETQTQAAQSLLLYELSLPFGLSLNNLINIDKSGSKITIMVKNVPTNQLLETASKIENKALEILNTKVTAVSSSLMFANISVRNIVNVLKGTLAALFLISLLLLFALKSFRLGVISLIPNVLPAALSFGMWGLVSGEINLAVSIVSSLTIGIVVDDTIHLLSHYHNGKKRGLTTEEAIIYSYEHTGSAIVMTTFILTLGYLVIAQSHFRLNSDFAQLTAITLVIALLLDLLILPCLLIWLDRNPFKKNRSNHRTAI
jgi:uncharacterized protein